MGKRKGEYKERGGSGRESGKERGGGQGIYIEYTVYCIILYIGRVGDDRGASQENFSRGVWIVGPKPAYGVVMYGRQ